MKIFKRKWPALLIFITVALLVAVYAEAKDKDLVSAPGQYVGYSEPIYDGYQRTSQYVLGIDGETRLAVDVYRPTLGGVLHEEPLPVVWAYTRYDRASLRNGTIRMGYYSSEGGQNILEDLLPYGYVVAMADARGTGASFGSRLGAFDQPETWDAKAIMKWLATQPWSDGNLAMYGRSYVGITQLQAASTESPYLKAIIPEMAWFDAYDLIYPGGVYNVRYLETWGGGVLWSDLYGDHVPVDDDPNGVLMAQAVAQHFDNRNVDDVFKDMPFRDSWDAGSDSMFHQRISADTYIDQINDSGVAIYNWAGWFDGFITGQLLWFGNLETPQKIIVGPWHHGTTAGLDNNAERRRWYDYYLKGIDNGIMDEPGLYYYTMGAPEGTEWRFTDKWPLPTVRNVKYYFLGGDTGSVGSVNDGYLVPKKLKKNEYGSDSKVADYTTSAGGPRPGREPEGYYNRWSAMYNGWGGGYTDMTPNDEKGFTYTTEPLKKDIEITGHPIVHLWVSSTADDGDFFVYLEEVDADGYSHYITEGILRASHRKISKAPWDNYLGLPYHSHAAADFELLTPGEPAELTFDLYPTSNVFDAGNRIRVTVTNADDGNFRTPVLDPAPTVTLYRDAKHASYILLPVNHKKKHHEREQKK